MKTWLTADSLEQLLRRIAPGDFGGRPIYVCFARELPDDLRPSPAVWGYTGTSLDVSLRGWLEDAIRWRGRGPAIVINDVTIAAVADDFAGGDDELRESLYRDRILATLLHESAHTLSAPIDYRVLPDEIADEVTQSTRAIVGKWITSDGEREASETLPPWSGHDAQFIRTLCHVVNRAYRLGVERIADHLIFDHRAYDLSMRPIYSRALEREVNGFDSWLTFHDLRQCRPPQQFVEQWKKDLHRWWNLDQSDNAMQHVLAAMRPYVSAK